MGEDRESKHKHHKKHSSSSKKKHKHKSEHKHKSSSSKKHRHHHKHGKSHKKHNKHKEKSGVADPRRKRVSYTRLPLPLMQKKSEEVNLQTALENLEMLEDILKTSTEFSPEELMEQVLNKSQTDGGLVDDSEDSSSDSDGSLNLGDKVGSPATLKDATTEDSEAGGSSGKGSSSAPMTDKTIEPQVSEEVSVPPVNEKKAEDGHKSETVGALSLTLSKDVTPSDKKIEDKWPVTVKVESKLPNSQTIHTKEEADLDLSSDSEAENKQKGSGGVSNGGGVFKPFSKKFKTLGSKTEIKINIRQKDSDKTTQSKEDGDSKESGSHKSSDIKPDSSKKESRESKRGSEGRRHKRSSRRSRTQSRSHSRSRSRSHSRYGRRHSRSPRRRRSRSRSRSYSRRSRRERSHSRSRRRSYSRSRRRSKSRSYSRSRRRSRSRSYSHSRRRSRSRSRSYSSSPPRSKRKKSNTDDQKSKDSAESKQENQVVVAETKGSKKNEISQLTAFCKDLQEKQAHEDVFGETPQVTDAAQIHHPFAVNPNQTSSFHQPSLVFHNNAWKTTSQLAIEAAVSEVTKPLVEKFPVSAGLQHTREEATEDGSGASNVFAKYQELSKLSVSDLVAKRAEIQRQILIKPADVEAHRALNYIEQQTSLWAESRLTPGQYTGQQKLTPLSKEAHNAGYQAWAKKNMFHGLAPVGDGFGMKMLKKMGWREGQPIGKQGEGHVEPICLDVKMDRSGLSTQSDYKSGGVQPASVLKGTKGDFKSASLVQGKHPVSALQELCARKRWDPPCYLLKENTGPAHLKMFLYQVAIPLGTFQPAVGSNSKKLAKMQAATAALQGLGLVEKTIEYTTL